MELTFVILMAFGIIVGIPLLIGFVIGGVNMLHEYRIRQVERTEAIKKAEDIIKEKVTDKALVA